MRKPAKLASPADDPSPDAGGNARGLPRRVALRPEIRAAMALEEAGELQEAARVFEYAGEHAQAALLRLEHARTLRDPGERIDVLREGSARNPGSTPEGRTLHKALALALLAEAEEVPESAKRRGLELEAAQALEEAEEGARAGELYESLGLLHKAAAAYERAGEVGRLELVLEVIDRHERHLQAQRDAEREVDEAIARGRRRYAYELLRELIHGGRARASPVQDGTAAQALTRFEPAQSGSGLERAPSPALVTRLQLLEGRLLRRDRVDLRWGGGRVTAVRGASRFVIGRAPEAELSLPGARLSRHHAELSVDATAQRPRLVATDLGSKVGTFVDGDPLEPGEPTPIEHPAELQLGMTTALQVHPVIGANDSVRGALVQADQNERWILFLPAGGPLWLGPDIRVPARLLFDRGFVVFDLASTVAAHLNDQPLLPGANIELMVGDRISLVGAPLTLEVLA